MAKKLPYRQKKNTGAMVVSIIELIAVLGTYLTIAVTLGLAIAQANGWIKMPEKDYEVSGDYVEDLDWDDYEGFEDFEEFDEPDIAPEPTPEPVCCPHCGAQLADEYVSFCDGCGLDPNAPAPTPTPEALTVTEMSRSEMQMRVEESGMIELHVDSTWESSTVDQKGTHNNTASALVDGNLETSWQEGVDGDGIGESVMLDFGSEVEVQYIEMYLGNHRSDDWFYRNNVPEQVSIYCYGAEDGTFEIVQANKDSYGRGATCIALSRPVPVQYLEFYIDTVYKGSEYDDTCIAEIKVYGYYK